jgi:hypothetical protein
VKLAAHYVFVIALVRIISTTYKQRILVRVPSLHSDNEDKSGYPACLHFWSADLVPTLIFKLRPMVRKITKTKTRVRTVLVLDLLIQAFIDTYKSLPKQPEFRFFPGNKNGNPHTKNGRLQNQPTKSKGQTFNRDKTFYVNDSFFLFDSGADLKTATPLIVKHFARFSLIMHTGSNTLRSNRKLNPS